mgnify:CR=1 FL=1
MHFWRLMKDFVLKLGLGCGLFIPLSPAFAHMYDSIGVPAPAHQHEVQELEGQFKDNCFVDPKLGPICK